MIRETLILLLLWTFVTADILSQSLVFKNYTVNDGLPSSEIYHIIQDKKGYIWIATNNGVSRFDGYEFGNFTIKDGLPDNSVIDMYEDHKGRIWFISFSAKLSYFFDGRIYKYEYNDKVQTYFNSALQIIKGSFYIDENEHVCFGTYWNGLVHVTEKGKIIRRNENPEISISRISGNKVITSRMTSTRPISLSYFSKDTSFAIHGIEINEEKAYSRIYTVATPDHFFCSFNASLFHSRNSKSYQKKEFGNEIICLYLDNQYNLWVGTINGGVCCFKTGNIGEPPSYNLLKDISVSFVCNDAEGGYWFSTLGNGIYYAPSLDIFTYCQKDGLPGDKVRDIIKDKRKGVLLNVQNNYLCRITDQGIVNYCLFDDIDFTYNGYLYNDITDVLWITTNTSLIELKGNNKNILGYEDQENMDGPFEGVLALYREMSGDVFLARYKGIGIIRNNTPIYSSRSNNFLKKIMSFVRAGEGSVWLGGVEGLNKFIWRDPDYKDIEFVDHGEKHELLSKRISVLKNSFDNKFLILGTKGAGLVLYDEDTVYNISEADGLTSNTISALEIDSLCIWAGTNKGLNKIKINDINNRDFEIQTFTTTKGLASNEINSILLKDDLVYIATNSGLTFFNRTKASPNRIPPPVYFTKVRINDKDTIVMEEYDLKYDENNIIIGYRGLSYRNAGNVEYKYMLRGKGDEDRWSCTKNSELRFPFLPYGEYTFIVKAMNEDRVWSEEPAMINFNIKTPFWMKWWFHSCAVIIIALIVIGILMIIQRIKIREIKQRNRLEKDLNKFKQQALTKQMNPHFIFNSLNSIQNFILHNDKRSSNKYLARFSRLMRITLENSQKQLITIEEELQMLNLYLELESLRFKEKFEYKVEVDNEIDATKVKIPVFLIQPYAENAIWHGLMHKEGAGKLLIEMRKTGDDIIIIIEDNGIGRERSMEIKNRKSGSHKSLGTKITESRLELINHLYKSKISIHTIDLKDSKRKATGTRVELVIPVITDQ